MKKSSQSIVLLVILITLVSFAKAKETLTKTNTTNVTNSVAYAFDHQLDHVQVVDQGMVIKILRDDTKGIKHQKFLLKVNNITILVAYNIDIAPRIPNLKVKDLVEFSGEYIWNNKGGLVHWTHHDPRHKHKDGWFKHAGKIYQ